MKQQAAGALLAAVALERFVRFPDLKPSDLCEQRRRFCSELRKKTKRLCTARP